MSGVERVRTLFVLPDPEQPGLSASERLALRIHRDASILGVCVCGATTPPVRIERGAVNYRPMMHEPDCPAVSSVLDRLVARLGDNPVYSTIVVELEVAA